jgi:hypothetical protein
MALSPEVNVDKVSVIGLGIYRIDAAAYVERVVAAAAAQGVGCPIAVESVVICGSSDVLTREVVPDLREKGFLKDDAE